MKRKPRKIHAKRDAESTAANKKKFLVALASGRPPGVAAKTARVARSTVYEWKQRDPAFSLLWDEAREMMLDEMEAALYDEGLKNRNVGAMLAVLRAYRPETWCKDVTPRPRSLTNNFFTNISIEEQNKRLQRLGLPPMLIESDIEDVADDDRA